MCEIELLLQDITKLKSELESMIQNNDTNLLDESIIKASHKLNKALNKYYTLIQKNSPK